MCQVGPAAHVSNGNEKNTTGKVENTAPDVSYSLHHSEEVDTMSHTCTSVRVGYACNNNVYET